jgi:hypothetical protein
MENEFIVFHFTAIAKQLEAPSVKFLKATETK